ncbi:glycosyltransferase [Cellulomonas sp. KRMCY2]|uniref:glycosyltransferase n=1 Tax=Cellulomonas sp. KRMCY2 TaxID=1304865 RepID=UPI00045E7D42|nr:glycosyltransferase [Cellulomonas sp. KRMCY2]
MLLDPGTRALPDGPPGTPTAHLLPHLIALCADRSRADARWLLLTATFGALPTGDQLIAFGRYVETALPGHAESALLAGVFIDPRRGRVDLPMTVVTDDVVVDVDFCARHDTHTGIHRVVRETIPRWQAEHRAEAVAWIDAYTCMRRLAPRESNRVFAYGLDVPIDAATEAAYQEHLIVPWRSVVVLADVPNPLASGPLAALATYSGNELALIGYDMIPVTSAEMRPASDSVAFAQYLTVAKRAHRIAGISRSATAEFTGFSHALGAQGLPGPQVREVQLASEPPLAGAPQTRRRRPRPVLLLVGSQEPHKNQRAALHAAARLWRDGLDFEVRLAGGRGWSDAVLKPSIERLVGQGRPLTPLGRVSDARLLQEMRSADVVFFASLHEGYGLPVTEALACGTPVITSNFGSQLEIAELGGCVVVDPRDDDDITAAIRRLLTDPTERARLRAQAAARPVRTWDAYASDLWNFLVRAEEVA